MKNSIKYIFSLLLLFVTLNGYSQQKNEKPLFTFCGKSGDFTMTFDEFKKCKKEITAVDKNTKINSFNVSVLIISPDGKDSTYTDYSNIGNVFGGETNNMLDKLISEKKIVGKILIENVKITEGDKNLKYPGWIGITLK